MAKVTSGHDLGNGWHANWSRGTDETMHIFNEQKAEGVFLKRDSLDKLRAIFKAVEPSPAAPAEPPLDRTQHLAGLDDTMRWVDGYEVKRKRDWSAHEKDKVGYVVVDAKCKIVNVMPGATWFEDLVQAKKGIAALELARKIVGGAGRPGGVRPH